jgi:hypothetical protein
MLNPYYDAMDILKPTNWRNFPLLHLKYKTIQQQSKPSMFRNRDPKDIN